MLQSDQRFFEGFVEDMQYFACAVGQIARAVAQCAKTKQHLLRTHLYESLQYTFPNLNLRRSSRFFIVLKSATEIGIVDPVAPTDEAVAEEPVGEKITVQYALLQAFPPLKAEDSSELILKASGQVAAVEGCLGHKEDIRQVGHAWLTSRRA
jgi:hypothetical protein